MDSFFPLRQLTNDAPFNSNDVLVIFGEVFQRGYVNGIIEEAQKRNMKVIFSTVGRRDKEGSLRALTTEELENQPKPFINIPLEAGFDMEQSGDGLSPVDQLQGVKLKEWDQVQLNWDSINVSEKNAESRFKSQVKKWVEQLQKEIPKESNVVFVHTMAGGVPRTKIVMPLMNRVFKGFDDRFMSSEEFWRSDIGRLCEKNFLQVTAQTFDHLIQETEAIRKEKESNGKKVSYVAYGYHGTELLIGGEYKWQSYAPYLQGFAKIELENIAKKAWKNGIKAQVFNAPEILTNSSSIFLGIEVALYPLLGALQKEKESSSLVKDLLARCNKLLKPDYKIESILDLTSEYFKSEIISQRWSDFPGWPQHNGPEQMKLMRETSQKIIDMHITDKELLTSELSEVVFKSCGKAMISCAYDPQQPVWWIGHDIVAKLCD